MLFFTSSITAKTIVVCASCEATSVKTAIEQAVDGDTILIKKGVYKEHSIIVIEKSLTILGEDNPVIDGELKGTIFSVKAKNVTIDGLTIKNVGNSFTKEFAAVLLSYAENFTITNLTIENAFFGILIEKSDTGLISGNTISGNATEEAAAGNGIHLWHSKNVVIKNNNVFKMRDGIYLEFGSNSYIEKNTSKNNLRYGLHFMFSNDNEYHYNHFENNGAGVAVMFSKKIIMYNNTFRKNWGPASYGLLLKEINDVELKNNIFEDNTVAINADGTNRIIYHQNNFIGNGYAIKVHGACYENSFTENNFLHNSFDVAYAGRVNSNKFNNNYWSDYSGYDLDKDGIGDVSYRPVKLFSYLVNKTPEAIILLRSLFIDIIDFSEKVSPIFTPAELVDENPKMKRIVW
ncbi:nitrous oxide reductase family maturation protein NosD [uncultured Planktosalinus sp.]|uniref:nitrous oxide reductase family maturation protein NosD n=1 Tax=uncultured Planktosalinus sp. TaxID=1810935 RepID=UPI0030D7F67D